MAPNLLKMDGDKNIPDVMEVSDSTLEKNINIKDKSEQVMQTDLISQAIESTSVSKPKCVQTSLSECEASTSFAEAPIVKNHKHVTETESINVKKDENINVKKEWPVTTCCDTQPVNSSVRPKWSCVTNCEVTTIPTAGTQSKNQISNPKVTCKSPVAPAPIELTTIQSLDENDPVVKKAYSLAKFIIESVTSEAKLRASCKVEETLLRNVTHLMTKHEITFRSMMRRLDINKDTGYLTFVTVANELFENQKRSITWSRILVLYAFGAQLAMYCKEKGFVEYAKNISAFMGKYAADVAGPFVKEQGGWEKLVEEFPSEDDLEDKVWKMLTWTAVGLGLATATVLFNSTR